MPKREYGVAQKVLLQSFKLITPEFDDDGNVVNYSQSVKHDNQGVYPNFPVLIDSKGAPWSLGNLYLVSRLYRTPTYNPDTFRNEADGLKMYLRWLEENEVDPLDFSKFDEMARPTYRYNASLWNDIHLGRKSLNYASLLMSNVVRFYKGLASYGIIEYGTLDLAWTKREFLIRVLGNDATYRNLAISTTDLNIKTRKNPVPDGYVADGEALRPLTTPEEQTIFSALRKSKRTYYLMFKFARLTGARIQTVGTMTYEALESARFDKIFNRYVLIVGDGRNTVNTKYDKRQVLYFSAVFMRELKDHWNSESAVTSRLISYYGDTEKNYLFLTDSGESFYSSKAEILERADDYYNTNVKAEHRTTQDFKPRKGGAIRTFIQDTLLPRIRINEADFGHFRFHDLRATFADSLLSLLINATDRANKLLVEAGKEPEFTLDKALEEVAERLGHSDITTTMRYLDLRRKKKRKALAQESFEQELHKYVPGYIMEALQ